MTNDNEKSSDTAPDNTPFNAEIPSLLTDLLYPSESDEPLEAVSCYLDQAEPLTVSQVKDWQMLPPSVYVEETPEADFWEPVTTEQDWFGEEEKEKKEKFRQLQTFIEQELTVRQVFRVGDTEIDVYLLGRLSTGERAGIKTKVVQT